MGQVIEELTVQLGERSYPIYIGEQLLEQIGGYFEKHGLSKSSPLLIVTDEHVAGRHLDKARTGLENAGFKVAVHVVAAGEPSKSLRVFEDVVTTALEAGLDRKSAVVALGGGVVGDLAGFVAASYMRGVRFIQIPTTILAHDSSVGGKVAVNHPLAKNIIGAFYQPDLVLYDTATLQTLPDREVRAGLSEMIKHGLIWDAEFTAWCEEHVEELIGLKPDALRYGLYKGCAVKAAVVSQDERENDLRAILNLGHTIGHALEAVAGYGELLHGEAIAIGMVGAARLSVQLGNPEHVLTVTERVFKKFGLPTRIPAHLDTDDIMKAMMHDKKFSGGRMLYIVPTEIGVVELNHSVSADLVRDIVDQLKRED